jgi:hypothetical protein
MNTNNDNDTTINDSQKKTNRDREKKKKKEFTHYHLLQTDADKTDTNSLTSSSCSLLWPLTWFNIYYPCLRFWAKFMLPVTKHFKFSNIYTPCNNLKIRKNAQNKMHFKDVFSCYLCMFSLWGSKLRS